MLKALTLIFTCQLIGELCAKGTGLPIPGPVLGMVILFLFFCLKRGIPEDIDQVGRGLMQNMSLLFVPAGAGVMVHFKLLGQDMLPIGFSLIVGTLITIAFTGLLMKRLSREGHKVE